MPTVDGTLRFAWATEEELLLLAMRREMHDSFERARVKAPVWLTMSAVFTEHGYKRTGKQLEDKWNKLKTTYYRDLACQREGSCGSSSSKFRHFDAMHSLVQLISPGRDSLVPAEASQATHGSDESLETDQSPQTPSDSTSHDAGSSSGVATADQRTLRKRTIDRDTTPQVVYRCIWSPEEEKLLISTRSTFRDRHLNRSGVWQDISQVFTENGFTRNAKQLEDKWYKLNRSYQLELERRKAGLADEKSKCRLFDEIHKLPSNADARADLKQRSSMYAANTRLSETYGLPAFTSNGDYDDVEDDVQDVVAPEPSRKRPRTVAEQFDVQRELLQFLRTQSEKQDAAMERSHTLMGKMLDLKRQQLDLFKSVLQMGNLNSLT